MIRVLGQNEYGLYSFAASIISYLSLLSLGFGSSYIRFYSRYKNKNDEEGIKKLNALYMIVFAIMSLLALIAGLLISFNVGIFFNNTYTSADLHTAKILMIFLTVNLVISFPASVFTSYITSHEKFIWQKTLSIIKTVLSPVLCIALLFLGYGSIGLVVVTTVVSVSIDVINVIYCFVKLKMRFKFGKIEKTLFREIFIFALFIAINQIVDQINYQTDKVILGKMINAAAVAVYAISATINGMYIQFSTTISNVFAPEIHRIVNQNEIDMDDKLTKLFIRVGRIQFFVIMLILTGFIFFGKYFIFRWAGEGYELSYYIAVLLLVPGTIPLIQNVGIEVQRAKNKHKFRSLVYLIIALLNVGLSIWWCYVWGIIGVVYATFVATTIGNIIIMNIYYHKVIKLNIIAFWKSIFRASLGIIVPCVAGVFIDIYVSYNGFLKFGLFVLGYIILYLVSVYFFGLNKEEKTYVNHILHIKRKAKNEN